jgi:hypothetical protein
VAAARGDMSRLVVGFLDPVSGWQVLSTTVLADGRLSASVPQPGALAILRLADTFWVRTIDGALLADGQPALQAGSGTFLPAGTTLEVVLQLPGALQVRTADGSLAWLSERLVGPVPAPDAAPPVAMLALPTDSPAALANVQTAPPGADAPVDLGAHEALPPSAELEVAGAWSAADSVESADEVPSDDQAA